AQCHRLHVTGVQFVAPNQLGGDVAELLDRVREFHAIDSRRVDQALHVLAKPEDRRTLLGFVAADALEHGRTIADHMGQYVEGCLVPLDPISVMPDGLGLGDGHDRLPMRRRVWARETAEYGRPLRASTSGRGRLPRQKTKLAGYFCGASGDAGLSGGTDSGLVR